MNSRVPDWGDHVKGRDEKVDGPFSWHQILLSLSQITPSVETRTLCQIGLCLLGGNPSFHAIHKLY